MIKKLMMLGGSIWFFAAVGMNEVNDFNNAVPVRKEGDEQRGTISEGVGKEELEKRYEHARVNTLQDFLYA